MKTEVLRQITARYFNDYPIFINIDALKMLTEAYNLEMVELHDIFRSIRLNIQFFENTQSTQYGLLNLLMYAIDAMFVDEEDWTEKRKNVTQKYKHMIRMQQLFFQASVN